MFRLIEVHQNNKFLIKDFCEAAGASLKTFRYFENRTLHAIDNHLVTYVMVEGENEIVGYGHLDLEDEIVWLGICMVENKVGCGYGQNMMHSLISYAEKNSINEINLSVDKENNMARSLYNKMGFVKYRSNEVSHFMKLELGEKNG